MLTQGVYIGFGIVEKVYTGCRHFPQVMGRNIGGHADGDAHGAIKQYMGQPCRQQQGFLEGAIKIGSPVHRALPQFRQQ